MLNSIGPESTDRRRVALPLFNLSVEEVRWRENPKWKGSIRVCCVKSWKSWKSTCNPLLTCIIWTNINANQTSAYQSIFPRCRSESEFLESKNKEFLFQGFVFCSRVIHNCNVSNSNSQRHIQIWDKWTLVDRIYPQAHRQNSWGKWWLMLRGLSAGGV